MHREAVEKALLANGKELTVRFMTTGDVQEVAKMEAEIFSVPWSENSFLEEVEREDRIFVVAHAEDKLAGYVGIIPSFDEADIANVAVASSMRRCGIAEKMLEIAMGWAREMGVKDFALEVRKGNAGAIALYEKLGFVTEGIRKNYYEKPTEDALIMWKR